MNYIPLEVILIILSVLAGFLLGRFVRSEKTTDGSIIIDTSDPEGLKWHMKFQGDLIDLSRQEYLILQVNKGQIKEDPTWRSES